jgi:hypothetical protein
MVIRVKGVEHRVESRSVLLDFLVSGKGEVSEKGERSREREREE